MGVSFGTDGFMLNVSTSIGFGRMSGNVNASGSHVESHYAGVNEQSGVHAGDGGFNVTVGGKTTLIGGVITSTDQAVRDGLNYFDPKGGIELHDIQNTASYSGSAAGFAVGGGSNPNGAGLNGTGIGIGTDKGSASSVTSSGVSGMYGNTAVRTGDGPTGIHRIFDADKVQKEIDAQNLLMQTFTREVPKAAGGFADGKARELQTSDPAEAAKWADGGVYRVALHTVIGGLGGGVGGAIGAGAAAAGARVMNDIQNDVANALVNAGMNPAAAQAVAQGVTTTAAIGIGGALGGGSGAALAGGIDANNRQLHPNEQQRLDTAKRGKSPEEQRRLDDAACALVHCASGLDPTSPGYAAAVQSQYRGEFYAAEQQQLRGTGAFTYTWTDQATDGVRSIGNTIVNVAGPQVQSASRGAANLLDQALSAMRSTDPTLPPDLPGNDNGPKTGGGGTAVVTPPLVACMPPMCVVMPPVVVGTAPRGNVTLSENSESQPTINTSSSGMREARGANGGVNANFLSELTANGVKFTPENVVATARSPNGQVVFLETGSPSAGLRHIIQEHAADFANIGVSEAQIPSVVVRAVSEGNIVGYQGRGTTRPIYEISVNGQRQRIAITTGSNGYIVGANPAGHAP